MQFELRSNEPIDDDTDFYRVSLNQSQSFKLKGSGCTAAAILDCSTKHVEGTPSVKLLLLVLVSLLLRSAHL